MPHLGCGVSSVKGSERLRALTRPYSTSTCFRATNFTVVGEWKSFSEGTHVYALLFMLLQQFRAIIPILEETINYVHSIIGSITSDFCLGLLIALDQRASQGCITHQQGAQQQLQERKQASSKSINAPRTAHKLCLV